MKALASTLGDKFAEDKEGINGGYPILAWQVSAPAVKLGDVNGDGEINAVDAAMVYAYYNGKLELTAEQLTAADVNGDGEVNAVDASLIYAVYNGKLEKLPADK